MDAKPVLIEVARALREEQLEAILIGNAAAALQGAPVTTVDLDFMIRRTTANIEKLKKVAKSLDAVMYTPHYPVSGMYRVMRDDSLLQVDFMIQIDGIKSFNVLRSRAEACELGGESLMIAALADIIASKRAADRPRDRAVIDVLEQTLRQKENPQG